MDIKISCIEIFVFRAPVDIPARTSFGVMSDRTAVLVRVEDDQGAIAICFLTGHLNMSKMAI